MSADGANADGASEGTRKSPSLETIETLARAAYEGLPDAFRALCGDIRFIVADFAEDEVLKDLGLESPFDLMGLFEGVGFEPLLEPETGRPPNRILLYRRAMLDYWCEHDETLEAVVSHVLIHEIGHHFGLSDADMEALESRADGEVERGEREGERA